MPEQLDASYAQGLHFQNYICNKNYKCNPFLSSHSTMNVFCYEQKNTTTYGITWVRLTLDLLELKSNLVLFILKI